MDHERRVIYTQPTLPNFDGGAVALVVVNVDGVEAVHRLTDVVHVEVLTPSSPVVRAA